MKSVGSDFASVLVPQYIMFRAGCVFLQKIKKYGTINIYVMSKNGCVIEIIFNNTQFYSLN